MWQRYRLDGSICLLYYHTTESCLFFREICHTRRSSVTLSVYQVASAFLISPSWHGRLTEISSDSAVDGCGRPPRVVLAVYHIPAHLTQVVGFNQSFVSSTYYLNCPGLYSIPSSATTVGRLCSGANMKVLYLRYTLGTGTGKRLYTSYLYQVPRYGIPKLNGPCARVQSFASTSRPLGIPNF